MRLLRGWGNLAASCVAMLLLSSVIAFSSVGTTVAQSEAGLPDNFRFNMGWYDNGSYPGSRLAVAPERSTGVSGFSPACASTVDPLCVVSAAGLSAKQTFSRTRHGSFGLKWNSAFPHCSTESQFNCISNVIIRDSISGDSEQAILAWEQTSRGSYYPTAPFVGDPSRGIPNGGLIPVYRTTLLELRRNPQQSILNTGLQVAFVVEGQSMRARCESRAEKRSPACSNDWRLEPRDFVQSVALDVTATSNPYYPADIALPSSASFEVTVRIEPKFVPRGWVNGRMRDPRFQQRSIPGGVELTFSGDVASRPTPEVQLDCSMYSRSTGELRSYFEQAWAIYRRGLPKVDVCSPTGRVEGTADPVVSFGFSSLIHRDVFGSSDSNDRNWTVPLAREAIEISGDRMGTVRNEWRLSWMPLDLMWNRGSSGSPCTENGLVGLVTTNSAMHSEYPVFDPSNNRMKFMVIGAHYLQDGSVNQGYVALTMRRDFAVCQWGVDPATTSLNAEITDPYTGVRNPSAIRTAIDGEYFRLEADGVTFSTPELVLRPSVNKNSRSRNVSTSGRATLNISKIVKPQRNIVPSWRLVGSTKCRIPVATPDILRLPKNGRCSVLLTEYNKRTKKSVVTLLRVQR
jgi:hypothetical protein